MALVIFILVLIVLILVHELGHFSVAKLFGIKVEEFGVFFPPRLFAKKWGETVYSFNLIPLGGFVKIFGESQTDSESLPSVKEDFSQRSRPVQAAVIVAGIVFNILFAWLLLSACYVVGMPTSQNHSGFGTVTGAHTTILEVVPGSPADKVGVKANDIIETVQTGTATLAPGAGSSDVQQFIAAHQEESMVLGVLRDGTSKTFLAKPALLSGEQTGGHKALGVELDDVGMLTLSPPLALLQGAVLAKEMVVGTAAGLANFFYSLVSGNAHWGGVSGPIGIATVGSSAVHSGFVATAILAALISINLAIINLVPVPGLDGGRLLFIAIEAILRRPITPKTSLWFTVAGFSLLGLLMLVVTFHDILNLVKGV